MVNPRLHDPPHRPFDRRGTPVTETTPEPMKMESSCQWRQWAVEQAIILDSGMSIEKTLTTAKTILNWVLEPAKREKSCQSQQ